MDLLKNKAVWIVLGIIVVALIIFLAAQSGQGGPSDTAAQEGTEDVSTGSVNAGSGGTLSYQQALTRFADRRIQFFTAYDACQATPNDVTYKDNTGIMLDNRSAGTRTIKIIDTYSVKAWGFKIVTLPDTYRASKTILVDCDRSQNVAQILVQE